MARYTEDPLGKVKLDLQPLKRMGYRSGQCGGHSDKFAYIPIQK